MKVLKKIFEPFASLTLPLLFIAIAVAAGFLITYEPSVVARIGAMLHTTVPIWVPILLGYIMYQLWVIYVQAAFIKNQETVLLEIKLPREIEKTPLAMETVFNGFHFGPGETTFIDRLIKGKVRPWWSAEIVSIGGDVHFYIWTRKALSHIIQSRIYAQYPDIEIQEVPDYTGAILSEFDSTTIWGTNIILSGDDTLPIKTYIDYGLDKGGVEEYEKVDPIASVIEYMGSLGPGEQMWVQILFQQHKGDWKKRVEKKVDELMHRDEKTKGPGKEQQTEAGFPVLPTLSGTEQKQIEAIQRSANKLAFDCGIRCIYLAEGDQFNGTNIPGMLSMLKQFNSETLNGFRPKGYLADFDYPWQDFRNILQDRARRQVFDAYRRRQWFHPPHKTPSFILNSEELATIYHFPGSAITTPTLGRIPSRRSEAPVNLPF